MSLRTPVQLSGLAKEPGSGWHGYQDIVDIDLKGFFDEVDHSLLLQLIYQRVKCPTTPAWRDRHCGSSGNGYVHPSRSTENCTNVEMERSGIHEHR
ncbi:hypothetical protein [Lunatimonas lonarensis]|uniref:hypothetical protein n=1 Tax=Lunatimonas lonarensis TaxID=1232681 RepID=UPI000686FBFA|nr:hypothetical protein [Lunatimonas lonarensis]